MKRLKQIVCSHDYERQSVYLDAGALVKKCRKCGKRVSENRSSTLHSSA
jgi:hypothetical protein